MKKFFVIAVLAIASIAAYAQPRAIGARLGAFDGFSYEHSLGQNMLEVEVGWGICGGIDQFHGFGHTIQAAVTYDWIDPFGATVPWNEKGEWHWYMGVGGAGGYILNNAGFVGAAGRFGIEYDFWFPMQLSLDYRPTLGAALYNGGAGFYWDVWGISLGIRYKF